MPKPKSPPKPASKPKAKRKFSPKVTPFTWFRGESPEMRNGVIVSIIGQIYETDNGFRKSLELWNAGDVSVIGADLETSPGHKVTANFLFKVDDGDPELLMAVIDGMRKSGLDFRAGSVTANGVEHESLAAEMGDAIVIVWDSDGDLAIEITGSGVVERAPKPAIGKKADVFSWFGRLSPDSQSGLLRALLAMMNESDPGMGQCLVAWRGGKASTIEADLEISRGAAQTVRFHIKSDDGDPRLLEALVHRLGAGNLEFELGRASTGGVVHDALLARLGYGVVAVRDLDGDLAINLSGSPAVTRVGNAIVGQQSPYPVPSEEGCVGGGVEARQSGE